jgi:acyl-ACP thioesterase
MSVHHSGTAHPPAVELVERRGGRVITRTRPVRLGDVDARARLRLDATARYLQDIATDDATDARLEDAFGWVVRRTLIDVRRPARLDETLELSTFCSGTGRSWAERRTSIVGEHGAMIEAVSLWIRVDPASGRPTGLGDEFLNVYGVAAGGRAVSSRLRLPTPPAEAARAPWPIRRVDIDPLHHVNNAAQWAIIEESLPHDESRRGVAEVEHRVAVDAETTLELLTADDHAARCSWLVSAGTVLTAARWTRAR